MVKGGLLIGLILQLGAGGSAAAVNLSHRIDALAIFVAGGERQGTFVAGASPGLTYVAGAQRARVGK